VTDRQARFARAVVIVSVNAAGRYFIVRSDLPTRRALPWETHNQALSCHYKT
jgi:hypothetical protein